MLVSNDKNDILQSKQDKHGILRLTLNDHKRRNALSEDMLTNLEQALSSASTDKSVRVVIIAAKGSAFCAGHDLKELTGGRGGSDKGHAYFTLIMNLCSKVMQSIINCPKPVIAEVAGVATAAGCQLVATCDLAVAATGAKFSTPGVHIGLFCSTPMVALSRNLSNKHAMEMLLTGDMTTAKRAAEIGLVNQVVPLKDLSATTQAIAEKIASKSSMTISTGKLAFYEQRDMPLSQAYDYAAEIMVQNMLAHDAKEGIDAFINKRSPDWQDK